MLRAPAHSFRQQASLAVALSWVGGYVNALTILACAQVTSHLTGAVSQLGVAVADGKSEVASYLLGLLAAFAVGAFAAGIALEWARARRLPSLFALPIALEAGLLLLFAVTLLATPAAERSRAVVPTLLAATAMGLQNATITRISGGVVRTTHLTGVVTDLGLDVARLCARPLGLGRAVTQRQVAAAGQRLWLLLAVVTSFAVGAWLGTLGFEHAPTLASAVPVLFLVVLLALQARGAGSVVQIEPLGEPAGPIAQFRGVPPPTAARFAFPDLTAWASHVPRECRVIVVDLADLHAMDEVAALELRALRRHLRDEGRFLVLSGMDEDQLQAIDDAGVLLDFDADDLCHDAHAAERRARELAQVG